MATISRSQCLGDSFGRPQRIEWVFPSRIVIIYRYRVNDTSITKATKPISHTLPAMTDIDFRNKQYARYEMWKEWDRSSFGSFSRKEHFYFKKLLAMLDSSNSNFSKLSILELGFGNGSFAGWLKANHPQIRWSGVDIQDSLVSRAKDSGFNAMRKMPEPARENQYDVILAFDVDLSP